MTETGIRKLYFSGIDGEIENEMNESNMPGSSKKVEDVTSKSFHPAAESSSEDEDDSDDENDSDGSDNSSGDEGLFKNASVYLPFTKLERSFSSLITFVITQYTLYFFIQNRKYIIILLHRF